MTHFMSYVVLLAAAIGACGVVLEATLERSLPRRWIWLSCLVATLAATGLAMVWPASASESVVTRSLASSTLLGEPTTSLLRATPAGSSFDVLAVADAVLPFAWLLSSVGLLLMIVIGAGRLRRERSRARPTALAGHPVLVSESIGPAVAGLRSPVVFIPNWVLALDEASQRLLMAHEIEHVRQRDTTVLFAGGLAAALVPWNPVIWWMVRRLRLAVEQDCDARVLAAHPGVRRYADLLLVAASRHGLTTRLLAAHFGEHSSDLLRRIDTMTRQRAISWQRVVPATAIAFLLLAAACETPRPAPVAPIAVRNEGVKEEPASTEVEKSKVVNDKFSVVVFSSDGKQLARYTGEIPVAHLPNDGVQNVKAAEYDCATSKCYSVRITLKPGYALNLNQAEVDKLQNKRSEVRSSLQEFKIADVTLTRGDSERIIVKDAKLTTLGGSFFGPLELQGEARVDVARGVANKIQERSVPPLDSVSEIVLKKVDAAAGVVSEGKKLAYTITRDQSAADFTETNSPPRIIYGTDNSLREPVNFELLSSGGEVISRHTTDKIPMEIRVDDIQGIEVYKPRSCPTDAACPLIRITLKPGQEAAYRKK